MAKPPFKNPAYMGRWTVLNGILLLGLVVWCIFAYAPGHKFRVEPAGFTTVTLLWQVRMTNYWWDHRHTPVAERPVRRSWWS